MTNDTDITPALTAEEWRWAYSHGIEFESGTENGLVHYGFNVDAHPRETMADKPGDWDEEDAGAPFTPQEAHLVIADSVTVHETHAPALIALLNGILPNDDPRKITRAMVDGIRALATGADEHESYTLDRPCAYCAYDDSMPTLHSDPVHNCPIFRAFAWADALAALLPQK
jgi:hypothetical protein